MSSPTWTRPRRMYSPTRTRPRKTLVLALAIATTAACIKTSHGLDALFQEYDQVAKILEEIWPEYKHDMWGHSKDFKESTIRNIRALMDTLISNKAINCRKKGSRRVAIDLVPQRRQENSASLLIMKNSQCRDDLRYWLDTMDDKIRYYNSERRDYGHGRSWSTMTCSDDNRAILVNGETCKFDTQWLGPHCTEAELFGYYRGESPCIIAQLNNLGYYWTPDVYKTIEELPTDMPEELITHIKEQTNDNGGRVPQMLWLNCKGKTSDDDEYIGEVEYTPWRGFPAYYFPSIDHENYVGPMVAVRFVTPTKNVLINIECRVYAKNISDSRSDNDDSDSVFGVMNFELFYDELLNYCE